jgi:hypothetical protein
MQSVTLDTIGGGALSELFEAELLRVLANINDPNTDEKTVRAINIAVKFRPNEDRDLADVELTCSSKLVPVKKVRTRLFMGRQAGKLVAVESDPRQSKLFDQPAPQLAAVAQFSKDGE